MVSSSLVGTMVSFSFLTAAASLSSVSCSVPPTVTTTLTQPAQPANTKFAHHGPYSNPYDDVPLPCAWPGKPTKGQIYPGPPPPTPFPLGGPKKDSFQQPAWPPQGMKKLGSFLPPGKQGGDSRWGDCDYPGQIEGLLKGGLPRAPGWPSRPNLPLCPTMPDTGVTRTYDFHLAYQTIAPDGIPRSGLVINGQYPGPLVEANWGDWIKFRVKNNLTDEGTTLHPHGLLQKETPWYDGVPAVVQCPITPNAGYFEMTFRADQYGTSWYHSHYSAQYSGGAYGPMIIYGPKHQDYDIDVGPVILEDWFHADYYTLVQQTMNGGRFPPSNNNLINGRMNYPCSNTTLPCTPNAGISKFKFQSGKKHLLRLINTGAEGIQKFSIDGHQLKVIAVDFVPIEPYTTNVVTITVGQRTDIIVEGIGKPRDSFWMRSQLGQGERCTNNDGISPNALAAVYYQDAGTDAIPTSTSSVTAQQLTTCKNDPLNNGLPRCKIPLAQPDHTERLDFDFRSNGTNFIWYVNNSTYRGDYNAPTLLAVKDGNTTFPTWSNVYQFPGKKNVRLHLVNHAFVGGHPMHLHGHDFQVLAEGFGEWDGSIQTSTANPVRRDVHHMQNARNVSGTLEPSYMVMQFTQDNPGVWPLHCHLAWHVSGGLFLQIVERPEEIKWRGFPNELYKQCEDWDAYTAGNPPNQIDSGL